MYFRCSLIISPLKRAGPFIWTNLNPLYPRMLCAKFGWNWPSGSGEDENVKSLQTDRQTDGWTDDGQQVIRKAHLSFQLRWAKNNDHLFTHNTISLMSLYNQSGIWKSLRIQTASIETVLFLSVFSAIKIGPRFFNSACLHVSLTCGSSQFHGCNGGCVMWLLMSALSNYDVIAWKSCVYLPKIIYFSHFLVII